MMLWTLLNSGYEDSLSRATNCRCCHQRSNEANLFHSILTVFGTGSTINFFLFSFLLKKQNFENELIKTNDIAVTVEL